MRSKAILFIITYFGGGFNMKIRILDTTTNKTWEESFTSPYLMNKRINKLRYSKKLKIISTTNQEA